MGAPRYARSCPYSLEFFEKWARLALRLRGALQFPTTQWKECGTICGAHVPENEPYHPGFNSPRSSGRDYSIAKLMDKPKCYFCPSGGHIMQQHINAAVTETLSVELAIKLSRLLLISVR